MLFRSIHIGINFKEVENEPNLRLGIGSCQVDGRYEEDEQGFLWTTVILSQYTFTKEQMNGNGSRNEISGYIVAARGMNKYHSNQIRFLWKNVLNTLNNSGILYSESTILPCKIVDNKYVPSQIQLKHTPCKFKEHSNFFLLPIVAAVVIYIIQVIYFN